MLSFFRSNFSPTATTSPRTMSSRLSQWNMNTRISATRKFKRQSLYAKSSVSEKVLFSYSWKLASVIEHNTVLNVHFLRSSGCVQFKEPEHYFSVKRHGVILSDICKFNYIHIPCNRSTIRYLIQTFAQSVTNIYLSRSSCIFLRLQGHYHGGI
jgi:hypothetical protein